MPVKVETVFTYADLERLRLSEYSVVVIDVLRATSSMCFALAAGCDAVMPFETVEALRCYAATRSSDTILLGGERGGLKIDGFDLGNSPMAYTPEVCCEKTLLITTTNGTRAIYASAEAASLFVVCMANVQAAAQKLLGGERDVILVCSGTSARYSTDDVICAGALVSAMKNHGEILSTENTVEALRLFENNRNDIVAAFFETEAGKGLASVGLGADVEFCAAPPKLNIVPKLDRQRMMLLHDNDGEKR